MGYVVGRVGGRCGWGMLWVCCRLYVWLGYVVGRVSGRCGW